MVKKILPITVVFFFAILAGFSLLHSGLPPTHDGEYHVIRFYEFDKILREGNIYPRWASDLNNGFGVPLFNYVYPLPNYVASFLHLFGISFIDAFKLNMFFATIFGGLFFYLWAKDFWGAYGAVVSSSFYTFSPYRFVDIYIRGSVGEVWALAFFPAMLWAITKLLKEGNKAFVIPSSVFLAAIIFSHNILALMFFLFLIVYIGFLLTQIKNKRYVILSSLYVTFLGLGLSSIFWLPALFEKQYVTGLQIFNIKENFPEFYQLIIPSWGSGFSGVELQNQMSFQIGIANLLSIVFSIIFLPFYIKKKIKHKSIIIFFLIWFMMVIFLMLNISSPIWENVPLINYFQFPWRFLSLEILIASFLAGTVFNVWNSKTLAFFLLILVVLLGIEYTKPAYYHNRNDNYYLTRPNFIDGTNSPGNFFNTIWMNGNLKKEKEKIKLIKGEVNINKNSIKTTDYKFNIFSKKDSVLLVNTAYFPGWSVFINKEKKEITANKDGLFSFNLPKGNYMVEIKFSNTDIRAIGEILSLTTLFIIIFLFKDIYCVRIKK